MEKFWIRHNAIVIYTFYMLLGLHFVPQHTLERLLHVPALTQAARAGEDTGLITARNDVEAPYPHDKEFDRLQDNLNDLREGK